MGKWHDVFDHWWGGLAVWPRWSFLENVRTPIWVVVSKIFYFHPYLGKWSKFEKYFFRWVGSTTNQKFSWENLWSRPTLVLYLFRMAGRCWNARLGSAELYTYWLVLSDEHMSCRRHVFLCFFPTKWRANGQQGGVEHHSEKRGETKLCDFFASEPISLPWKRNRLPIEGRCF